MALSGHLVFDHGFGDGEGKTVLVVATLDVGSFGTVGEEAAFKKNGRMLDPGDDGVAGAAYATVASGGVLNHGGVDSGRKGDIRRVVVVAWLFTEVRSLEATPVVSDPFG